MDGMPWFKWWDGTTTDTKFAMVAKECGQPVACVIGIWAYLLEYASRNETRGSIAGIDYEEMAFALQVENVETVCNAMKRRGIVTETGEIAKWEKRQAKREKTEPAGASTARVQRYREKLKANTDAGSEPGVPGNDDETDETAGNGAKRPKKKKKKEISKPKPVSSSGDDGANLKSGFDTFWQAYPRKQGKQDAAKAWGKLKPDAELQKRILDAIAAQKEGGDWLRDDGEYIPHPTTWLNGGRWLDEVRPFVPPQQRRATDAWWTSIDTMRAKGAEFSPPIVDLPGESIVQFKKRIDAAIAKGTTEAPAAPTPYVPPMPKGGENVLTDEQKAVRSAELLALVGKRRAVTNTDEAA